VPGPPLIDVAAIRAYCDGRVPAKFLDQLRVEAVVDGNAVTIVERRPPWREDFGPEWTTGLVARLGYTHKTATWSLFWRDRNQRWHRYTRIGPSARITVLLDEIEADPAAIFWG
jgi:hypothetical protein